MDKTGTRGWGRREDEEVQWLKFAVCVAPGGLSTPQGLRQAWVLGLS